VNVKNIILCTIILICLIVLVGCIGEVEAPHGAYKVSDLYTNQFYSFKTNPEANRESPLASNIWEKKSSKIRVYGKVEHMGDFLCPCFALSSGGKSIVVWYAPMGEDDNIKEIVELNGIKNGDYVIVTGELRIDVSKSLYEFRAVKIVKIE